ncbi:MAG: hypothetical protein KKC76_08395 [Proteobacteria bacterium]|nr:hypothetical protein [Pseudomonadota bacterium]MBU4297487.1 hypothetical protein [Pseudomonadota bacterium]MCG2749257.1 hypothetical protein [Desulfobulbaceae bacterium]
MNRTRMTMVLVFLLGLSMTQVAWAHRRSHGWRGHVGIYIAPPPFWRYYPPYPPPYYYPQTYYYPSPPVYVTPPQPPVYIERPQAESAAPQQVYWYYCTDPAGYYPTVKECPGGWLQVLPQTQQNP